MPTVQPVLLKPGESVQVGNFTVRHDAIRLTEDGQKQMITARMSVFDRGEPAGEIAPAKWFYNKREDEPTTEVAIRRSFAEDLYVVMAGFDIQQQSATFHVVVNPLVNWIWAGFGIGPSQFPMAAQALLLGGNMRVGLEDNLMLRRGVPATNAQLVERAVAIAAALDIEVLGPDATRRLLGLPVPRAADRA
jgi:cytochrome c biogenesis factor